MVVLSSSLKSERSVTLPSLLSLSLSHMTFRLPSRILGGVNSSSSSSSPPPPPPQPQDNKASHIHSLDSDFVVILAALLCALICVLGLVAVARCAWIRRISDRTARNSGPPPPAANKGLKKKVLKSFPRLTYSSDDAGKFSDCAICLAEFVDGDEIRVLPQCGHGFHAGCIDTWLASRSSCPSCRQILVATTRCEKCGELPSSSATASAETEAVTTRQNAEHQVNRFLP